MVFSRRLFLLGTLASFFCIACERHKYIREEEQKEMELDLGPVKELLFTQTHLPLKSILLYRDINGWSALSTRCTYEGCDLTYQEPILLCPCCFSTYDMFTGLPHEGSTATRDLPWFEVTYKAGHLYAHPGKRVDRKWRLLLLKLKKR
jgi:Rieske Fe-S protein